MVQENIPNPERKRLGSDAVIADCIFLVCVAFSTAILWINDAGFSDDWSTLQMFRFAPDQSLLGLFKAAFSDWPGARMRPLQLLYLAADYKLWGLHPLGYHVVNVIILSAIGILSWLLLRELGRPRVYALAFSVLYITLPNYSTSRFWITNYQSLLSIALYLLSFYADLRSLRADGARVWGWRVLGVASLISSVMAYEVALPLFAMNFAVVLFLGRREMRTGLLKRARVTVAFEAAALLGVTIFKVVMRTRPLTDDAYVPNVIRLVKNAVDVHWRGYGFGLPLRVWHAATRYPDTRVLWASVALAFAVAAYLWWASDRHEPVWSTSSDALTWLFFGALAFGLGFAMFLIAQGEPFTMMGSNNRVAVAATLGVAVCFVAATSWLIRVIPAAGRGAAFSALIGLLAAGGFLIDNTVANFWVGAYRKEMVALAAIRERFPRLPAHSTLILDGVCPYVGPARVFKSQWDLAGLLALTYNDPTLKAEIFSNEMAIRADGILGSEHQSMRSLYLFSDDLIVFDPRSDSVFHLRNSDEAKRYFERRPKVLCPPQLANF